MNYRRQAVARRCRRLACLVASNLLLATAISSPLSADGPFVSAGDGQAALAISLTQNAGSAPATAQGISRSASALPIVAPSPLAAGSSASAGQFGYPAMQVSHHAYAGNSGLLPQMAAVQPISTGAPPDYSPHGMAFDPHMMGPCVDPNCNVCGAAGTGHHSAFKEALWITAQRYDDHWVQVYAEALFFDREDNAGNIPITSDGIQGPILMSTDDVILQGEEGGTRLSAAFDMFANSFDLELSYFGHFQWSNSAQVTSNTNSLYSIFSDFGQNPPQVGFESTDQATLQRLNYDSELDNFEINTRFRWSHSTKPITGAWILGVRYLRVDERLDFFSFAEDHIDPFTGNPRGGELNYALDVDNDLVGFQVGGEFMVAIWPGLLVGADFEGGIYGNNIKNIANIREDTVTSGPAQVVERQMAQEAAFVGEANVRAIYRIYHNLYARVGYQAVFVDGLALAVENFNTAPPFFGGEPRQLFDRTDGNLFLHGAHVGVECQW